MKHKSFLLTLVVCLISINNAVFGQIKYNDNVFNFNIMTNPVDLQLPNACDLLSASELKDVLNIRNQEVTIKSTKNPGEYKVSNCFYKWNDPNTPHAGVLFQVLTNPIFEDNPFYISDMILSKINEGDQVEGSHSKVRYKEMMVGKVKVAYAHGASRCYWNVGENFLFSFAFNMYSMDEEAMVSYIKKLVPVVNKNFIAKMLE